MYDPTAGAVLLDQHDLRDLNLSSIRAAAAVVPQVCACVNPRSRLSASHVAVCRQGMYVEYSVEYSK